jgi:hypothetical protein
VFLYLYASIIAAHWKTVLCRIHKSSKGILYPTSDGHSQTAAQILHMVTGSMIFSNEKCEVQIEYTHMEFFVYAEANSLLNTYYLRQKGIYFSV